MAAVAGPAQLAGLRAQLEGLQYDAAPLTPAAVPLVAALLGDLVRATDSYRELKARAAGEGEASQALRYQVRGAHVAASGVDGARSRLGT